MTIEELKALRHKIEQDYALPHAPETTAEYYRDTEGATLLWLIDAEIARQSVTDEDVVKAIKSFEGMIQYHAEHEDEYRKNYGGKIPTFIQEMISESKLSIDALKQYRKEETE